MSPFAAVLLAGGRSRRMGCDKAFLPLPGGRFLWQRQLAVLWELGPAELFISGPARPGFPENVRTLDDAAPNLGPLAGIAAALAAMCSPRLLVLAVDLPAMTTGFLDRLLAGDRDGGVIPRSADGFFEPLAAVYPQTALPVAERLLRGKDRSLQTFAGLLLNSGQAVAHPFTTSDATLFTNWNAPNDISVPDCSDQ